MSGDRDGIHDQHRGPMTRGLAPRCIDRLGRGDGPSPAGAYSPYERPITSSITSSVPAPMRFRRMSRHARSMPYSFM